MVAPRASLPAVGASLVGRAEDLAALVALLETPPPRLVTLTGPPGVGKTRLATEVARTIAEHDGDRVVWVDLAPVRSPERVLAEIAVAAGAATSGTARAHEELTAVLADRDLLLVLDNCEHLLGAAPAIGRLVADLPRLRVLATSRERLRLVAEHEHPVSPLSVPDPAATGASDLRRLTDNPSVALLLAHAPRAVTLTVHTAPALVDICRQLDGLPLALEFAAARLRVFTPGELAFRLHRPMRELTGAARDAPPRHRDLRSAIRWSHDLLPDAERVVFRRLSVFAGPVTLEAAEAVCGGAGADDVLAAVGSLLDKSLLGRADTPEGSRYSMLVSLKEYAAEQLAEHDERATTRARHAAWGGRVARTWEASIGAEDENRGWLQIDALRPDLELALDTAESVGDGESRCWSAAALGWYWYIRGSPAHARFVLGLADLAASDPADLTASDPAAAPPDQDPDPAVSHDARTALALVAGVVSLALGDLDGAERHLQDAARASEGSDAPRRLAVATAFLGHVARERGAPERAAERYHAALALHVGSGNDRGAAWAHCDLGQLAAGRGDLAGAEVELEHALVCFEALDYPWAIAVAAVGLGDVLVGSGRVDAGSGLLGRALTLHEEVGDQRGTAQALEGLADAALRRGSPVTAARLLGAAAGRRVSAAVHPTDAERVRIAGVEAGVERSLGTGDAARERHRGRTTSRPALLDLAARVAAGDAVGSPDARLTARQAEVAALVAAGRTNRQIARSLGISEKTAELHVRGAMQRLGVANRAGVAAWVGAHARDVLPG